MNAERVVNFETYYFLELLERIRNAGTLRFSGEKQKLLNRFVADLSVDTDAQSAIEKLATKVSTGDISIFFSDILERLHRMNPEESFEQLDQCVEDFLEIFGVMSEEEDWKKEVLPEAGPTEAPVSIQEFCLNELMDQLVAARQSSGSEKVDARKIQVLKALLTDVDYRTRLFSQVGDEEIQTLLNYAESLIPADSSVFNANNFMNHFYRVASNFISDFNKRYGDYAEKLISLLGGEREGAAPEEIPMEEMFTSVEEGGEKAGESGRADEGAEDEVAALASELAFKQPKSAEMTEEQKDRRRFLRDYVVGEIEAFRTELSEYIRAVVQNPTDSGSRSRLEESLRALKDLGQIHSYPGIENLGMSLLDMIHRQLEQKSGLPAEIEARVEEVFAVIPAYVDANLSGNDARELADITNRVERLKELLGGAETAFTLNDREAMLPAFQDVVLRVASHLRQQLSEAVPDSDTIVAELENARYWAHLLNLEGGAESAELIRDVFAAPEANLSEEKTASVLNDALAFWEQKFSSASGDEWRELNGKLSNLLAREPEVSVAEAGEAYQEVCARLVDEFIGENLQGDLSTDIWEKVTAILDQLEENSRLAGNGEFAYFCRHCRENFEAFEAVEPLRNITVKEAMSGFFGQLKGYFEEFPAVKEISGLETAFDELIAKTSAPQAEPEAPAEEEPSGVAAEETGEEPPAVDEERVTDDEILQVFKVEGRKYLRQIEDHLFTLEGDVRNKDVWNKLSIAVHTLNGSSKMIGYGEMVELATPMEDCIEMVKEEKLPRDSSLVSILKDVAGVMEKRLTNPTVDAGDVMARLQQFSEEYLEKGTPVMDEVSAGEILQEISEETEEAVSEPVEISETEEDLLHLKEQDPELLGIFTEEVSANYDVIERNLANLEKFTYDKAAWKEIEQAVHEIHGAAKMLGLAEIGSLAQKMEALSEAMVAQRPVNSDLAIPTMRRSMLVVRELTSSHQISQDEYRQALQSLESILMMEGAEELPAAQEDALSARKDVEPLTPEEVVQPAPQLMEAFLQESRELLDDMNYLLLKLEKDPDNTEMKHHLMRSVHTLKGSAGMVYATHIEKLSHLSEDITEHFVQSETALPPDYFDLMLAVADELSFTLEALETEGKERSRHYDELLVKLTDYMRKIGLAAGKVAPLAAESGREAAPSELVQEIKPEAPATQVFKDPYIRLKIGQMNRLLNLAAELVIGHTQFKDQLDRLKQLVPTLDSELKIFREIESHLGSIMDEYQTIQGNIEEKLKTEPGLADSITSQLEKIERIIQNVQALRNEFSSSSFALKDNSKNYDENLQKLNKMSNELLDEIMQARMVPINMLFQRFQRPIRDLAKQFGKKIELQISGEKTELDRTLIDELYEPLLHMIRNAIDHGLETPAERAAKGKPETGRLEIKASSDRNQVIIKVSDDGAGIDLEKIKEKAVQKGLVSEEKAAKLSNAELTDFLFQPGFSTASETTMVSGRGVGMDVVKARVEKIKGDVRLSSEDGKGTTITIRVPISLSVVQSMLIDVAGHHYSIPLTQVEETLRVGVKDFVNEGGVYYLHYREEKVPVVQLSQLLIVRGSRPRPISVAGLYPVIVVQSEGRRIGLLVDHIVRREEILIKSLGPTMQRLKFITGGCIMADGQVVLVLDIPEIIEEGLKLATRGEKDRPLISFSQKSAEQKKGHARRSKKIIEGRKPKVLIVDDSLSIRKYLSGLLMQKGYITETARNGYEALELLNNREFDLMVSDLEMPKLSGYELIENVRGEERFADFPIIVLTGRANENIRRLTEDLGADAYIIKPFKDRELFEAIQTYIEYHF